MERPKKDKSVVWKYFEASAADKSKTICQLCHVAISYKGNLIFFSQLSAILQILISKLNFY